MLNFWALINLSAIFYVVENGFVNCFLFFYKICEVDLSQNGTPFLNRYHYRQLRLCEMYEAEYNLESYNLILIGNDSLPLLEQNYQVEWILKMSSKKNLEKLSKSKKFFVKNILLFTPG
ncbi:MAG: hypothetical protein U0T83_06505 [Bacteriovoracaceae bacterium]